MKEEELRKKQIEEALYQQNEYTYEEYIKHLKNCTILQEEAFRNLFLTLVGDVQLRPSISEVLEGHPWFANFVDPTAEEVSAYSLAKQA